MAEKALKKTHTLALTVQETIYMYYELQPREQVSALNFQGLLCRLELLDYVEDKIPKKVLEMTKSQAGFTYADITNGPDIVLDFSAADMTLIKDHFKNPKKAYLGGHALLKIIGSFLAKLS